MTCPKCHGLVVQTFDEEDPVRCLQCGYRPNVPLPASLVSARIMGTSQCQFCANRRAKYSLLCRECSIREGSEQVRGRACPS